MISSCIIGQNELYIKYSMTRAEFHGRRDRLFLSRRTCSAGSELYLRIMLFASFENQLKGSSVEILAVSA